MNRTLTALALAFALVPSAWAQEHEGSHWHVSGANEQAFMTTNIHKAQKLDDGTILASSAMYFSTTQQVGSSKVDFAVTVEQFDCAQPYRYRTVAAEGYIAHVEPPVFKSKDLKAPWGTAEADTLAGSRWNMVCKGIPERTALYDVETHEQVMDKYRASTQGSGMDLPPEAEQILRDLSI